MFIRSKQDLKKVEVEKKERSASKSKAEEAESYAKKKLEMSKMSLLKAEKAETDHLNEVKDAVSKAKEAEEKKKDFERKLQSDANRVILDEETNAEYQQLKKEVGLKSADFIQDLNKANRDQKKNKDDLENLVRQHSEILIPLKQKQENLKVAEANLAKLNDSIAAAEDSQAEEKKRQEELEGNIESADGRLQELENQLKKVEKDLDRAQFNRYQAIARTKKMELEEALKFHFSPSKVFGRISSLCQPVSERYEMAVTRVLEKKMDFIVVDTEETAQMCIDYLNANKLKPETFLPIDRLHVRNIIVIL